MPDAMQTALRVLDVICQRKYPDQEDVEELQRLAPIYANLPIDELACKVVNAIVEQNDKKRAMRNNCRASLRILIHCLDMRDAARIDEIAELIRKLWKKYPEWRLGQLVMNAHAAASVPGEAHFAEDDVLERGLRRLLDGPSDGGERVSRVA